MRGGTGVSLSVLPILRGRFEPKGCFLGRRRFRRRFRRFRRFHVFFVWNLREAKKCLNRQYFGGLRSIRQMFANHFELLYFNEILVFSVHWQFGGRGSKCCRSATFEAVGKVRFGLTGIH